MAVGSVEGLSWNRQALRAGLRDISAGAICSLISLAHCLSYAALIFSGPLTPWLSNGIVVTFVSAAIAAAVLALRSSFPFAIGAPDTSTSAVTATLVAAFAARLVAHGQTDLLPPVLLLMALATAATGILLSMLGFSKAGRAIRFVPYPVIGGFLGATGWLMILGAVHVITDQQVTLPALGQFASGPVAAKLAAGLAVAVILEGLLRRWNNAYVAPAVLLAAILAVYAVLAVSGTPLSVAQSTGWMFQPQANAAIGSPWHFESLRTFPWGELPWLAGDILAVMFVTTISLLLNATGIEMATRREADINRELKALGIASLLSSAFGGYVSSLTLSRTVIAHSTGATGRLTGLTVAAISGMVLVVNTGFLGYVPKYALGGLLFFSGARLLHKWLIQTAWKLQLIDYLSLAAIALIIIQWGFIAGVLIGVAIGCATFALSASRVNAVKFSFDGSEYRSSLDRSPAELALLNAHGRELQGMALQSYLFFGSANRLFEQVKAVAATRPECRFLLFDFRLVTGIDSSATHSFAQIKEAADGIGAKLVLVCLTPELRRAFRNNLLDTLGVTTAENLDRALEACEDQIIAAHQPDSGEVKSLRAWLSDALGSPEQAEHLAGHCVRLDVEDGQEIARQGDPSDSMHFILEGRVGIFVRAEGGHSVRVRSLGRQTMIGEMGLVTGRPRSAAIRAEAKSVLYQLPVEAYRQITKDDPALGQALFKFVIEVMAERLSFASRLIGVLQR